MANQPFTICICGAGTMGSGIAQVFAQHGFNTILFDLNVQVLEKAREKLQKKIHGATVSYTSSLQDCKADIIIEAVLENMDVKTDLFNKLSEVNNPSTIFATNTSSLSVSSIAENTARPAQLAGMHFFNPAPAMQLVEIVQTDYVSQQLIETLSKLARAVGKTPVVCKDAPGFIVNHVARPYYLEALYLVEKRLMDIAVIDRLMEASGFRMGPFKLMDLIGNDINYSVSCIVYDALGKPPRLQPSPVQKEKVAGGLLGKKTGKGYYEYPNT